MLMDVSGHFPMNKQKYRAILCVLVYISIESCALKFKKDSFSLLVTYCTSHRIIFAPPQFLEKKWTIYL